MLTAISDPKDLVQIIFQQSPDLQFSKRFFNGREFVVQAGGPKENAFWGNWILDYYAPYFVLITFGEQQVDAIKSLALAFANIFPEQNFLWQHRGATRGNEWLQFDRNSQQFISFAPIALVCEELHVVEKIMEKLNESEKVILKFHCQLGQDQNTGLFLDMVGLRHWFLQQGQTLIEDKKILNLFSYTGAMSVALARAGAKEIHNIDMKKSFLNISQKNHALNEIKRGVFHHDLDILKSYGRLERKGPYDWIISDPPSNQTSFQLKRHLPNLLKRLGPMLALESHAMICANDPFVGPEEFKEIIGNNFSRPLKSLDLLPTNKGILGEALSPLKVFWLTI